MKMEKIFDAVKKTGFDESDIIGRNRSQPLALIRQICIYLAKEGRTWHELSYIFKRDHANCIYAIRVIKERISINDYLTIEMMQKMGVK